MMKSKSVPALSIPGWAKAELTTPIDKVIRAKEIGKHHKRIHDQRADIDNDTPRIEHYQKLRQRLFTIKQQTINKKVQNDNIELLRHLITLSQDEPNYKTYPKSHHMAFAERMGKLARKRRRKEIAKENQALKDRLGSIKPSKSLKTQKMARDFKKHQQLQRQFLFSKNQKRKQPDVIEYRRAKLTKKERSHFRKPLNRPKTPDMVQNKVSYKSMPRPMTPNTYKFNLYKAQKEEKQNGANASSKRKRRRIQSARGNRGNNSVSQITQNMMTSPPTNKQSSKKSIQSARNAVRYSRSPNPTPSSRKHIQSARPAFSTNLMLDVGKMDKLCAPEKEKENTQPRKARTSRSRFDRNDRSKSMRAERRETSHHRAAATARTVSKGNTKWEDILAEDMADFGVETSPRTMKKLSKGLNVPSKFSVTTTSPLRNSPGYIMRASRIYDHKHKRIPHTQRERIRSHKSER